MSSVAYVATLPKCDFCKNKARYDGKTSMGPWANMCPICFGKHGIGVGTGRGQELLIQEKKEIISEEIKTVTMDLEDLEEATMDGVWYPICPYCGEDTPAEPDAHSIHCNGCNNSFKINSLI